MDKKDWPNEFPGAYWLDEKEDEAVLDVLHNIDDVIVSWGPPHSTSIILP